MVEILKQRSKEKLYRGKNVDELKKMDTREFAKLVKARARRAILRNFDVIDHFVKRCINKENKNKLIRTHNRSLIIVPVMIGKTIWVYNGHEYSKVSITQEMLGHRLGEFSLTRKSPKHGAAGIGATKSSASRAVK
tara:strand:- start:10139 stop:10546 length:408 start_codon:yes stop_codon:yes gene_type:complete